MAIILIALVLLARLAMALGKPLGISSAAPQLAIGLIQLTFLAGLRTDWGMPKAFFDPFLSPGARKFILTAAEASFLSHSFFHWLPEALPAGAITGTSSFGISVSIDTSSYYGRKSGGTLWADSWLFPDDLCNLLTSGKAGNVYRPRLFPDPSFSQPCSGGLSEKSLANAHRLPPPSSCTLRMGNIPLRGFDAGVIAFLGGALIGMSGVGLAEKIAERLGSGLFLITIGVSPIILGMEINLSKLLPGRRPGPKHGWFNDIIWCKSL